jgi:hypothetical protein
MKPKTFFYIMMLFTIIASTFAFVCFTQNKPLASIVGAIIGLVCFYGATISPSNNNN